MTKTNKKILHVDDESDTLEVVKIILEKEGYGVDSVKTGKDALNKVKKDHYDLLILDIMMPDISGWDLFTWISKRDQKHKVIFLSVLDVSESRLKQLKSHGVKDYITKPFDRDDLVARINSVISV